MNLLRLHTGQRHGPNELVKATQASSEEEAQRTQASYTQRVRHRPALGKRGHKRVSRREDSRLLGREPVESPPARHGQPIKGRLLWVI